jgi:hypothetical protein
MTRFELSRAFPFRSLKFVVVLLQSGWIPSGSVALQKYLGIAPIVLVTMVAASG